MSLQNLFVAKLPRNLTDNDLHQIFAVYGPSSAKIMLDAATGRSKGFGFVLFDSEEKGEKAYKALNRKSTRACGHNFTLAIYPSNHDGKIATEASNSLYIRNIPLSVPQDKVENFLKTFGNLTYCAMREDHYGSPVWVVYAEYERVEDAKNALSKLHGNNTYFHGSAPILAKYEDTDDAKRERRKRREGTGNSHSVPNSGCIFPPPRPHHHASHDSNSHVDATESSAPNHQPGGGGAGGVLPAGMATSSSMGGAGSIVDSWDLAHSAPTPETSNFLFAKRGPPPPQLGNSGNGTRGGSGGMPTLPTAGALQPPFAPPLSPNGLHNSNCTGGEGTATTNALHSALAAAMLAPPPTQAFSLPVNPQLLHPTPGYCYTLSGSGQQIFIPAASLSPPAELANGVSPGQSATASNMPNHFRNAAGAASGLLNGVTFSSNSHPGAAGAFPSAVQSAPAFFGAGSPVQGANNSGANLFPLLNPQSNSPVVLVDGTHPFVLSGDTINLGQKGLGSSGTGSPCGQTASCSVGCPHPMQAEGHVAFSSPPLSHVSSSSVNGEDSHGNSGAPFASTPGPTLNNLSGAETPMFAFPSPTQLKQQQQQAPSAGSVGDQDSQFGAAPPMEGNYLFVRAATGFDA